MFSWPAKTRGKHTCTQQRVCVCVCVCVCVSECVCVMRLLRSGVDEILMAEEILFWLCKCCGLEASSTIHMLIMETQEVFFQRSGIPTSQLLLLSLFVMVRCVWVCMCACVCVCVCVC